MERKEKDTRKRALIPMKRGWLRKKLLAAFLVSGSVMGLSSSFSAAPVSSPKLKALIVTGQNDHNWKTSSAALEQMLENTGLFEVEVAISPEKGESMEKFSPDFSSYRLVVLDYSGDEWSPSSKKAFVDYVQAGGGVVVYHAADNTFARWKEYNRIIGLGGWNGRDQSSGPYVYWKDGEVIRDKSPGRGGQHTSPHAFLVVGRNSDHPITRGLPEKWMHAEDELYGLLRGPAENLEVLATAYSDPACLGTGRNEPVLFTVRYGKGRIFHTVLGHAGRDVPSPALECVGFIVTFQRGAEWAATGEVTQEIPGFFPAVNKDYGTPDDVRCWKNYRAPDLNKILGKVSAYDYGKDEEILSELREYVRAVRSFPKAREECEKKLAKFLEADATLAAKMAVCRHLREIGTSASVPALEEILRLKETSDMARYALEKIPGSAAEKALIQGLSESSGKVKTGIIVSLGNREDRSAVMLLERELTGPDEAAAIASALALGQIADQESVAALSKSLAEAEGELKEGIARALLNCAEKHLGGNDPGTASEIFEGLIRAELPLSIRRSAMKGRVASSGDKARSMIVDVLKGKDEDWYSPAISMVREFYEGPDIREVCSLVPDLPAENQVQMLEVLSHYRTGESLSAIMKGVERPEPSVRVEALKALRKAGDETSLEILIERAARTKGEEQAAARTSVWNLKGKGIDEALLLNLAKREDPDLQEELILSIGERRIAEGLEWLMDKTASTESGIRQQAIKSLKDIAAPEDLPRLVDLILSLKGEKDRLEMASTIASVAREMPHAIGRARAVINKLPEIRDVKGRAALYRTLGKIGDDSSLPVLRAALDEENPAIRDAAVRALAEWPTAAAQEDLFHIARTSSSPVHKTLSLQAYIRTVEMQPFRSPERAVESLTDVLDLCRPEEKKLILGILPAFASQESLALAESLLREKDVEAEARLAVEKIKEKLR
jgi:HEAT repeat protein/type 1 glutamine amidotransferase